jgi:hypothetical protein
MMTLEGCTGGRNYLKETVVERERNAGEITSLLLLGLTIATPLQYKKKKKSSGETV